MGCVGIGSTMVRKVFGCRPFLGNAARFRHPLYLVDYVDGDKAECTGKKASAHPDTRRKRNPRSPAVALKLGWL
jgi:hypothetical protein